MHVRTASTLLGKTFRKDALCFPGAVVVLACLAIVIGPAGFAASGDYGGDLNLLSRQHHISGDSAPNHYFTLWPGLRVESLADSAGVTNTRTLFITSHGMTHSHRGIRQFALAAHEEISGNHDLYSLDDFARAMGPENAALIHNVVLSACNVDGLLTGLAVRRVFRNATNVVHAPAGAKGYTALFYQVLVEPSDSIQPLYERRMGNFFHREYLIQAAADPRATRMDPYVAELFAPSAERAFSTVVAGRELLVGNVHRDDHDKRYADSF